MCSMLVYKNYYVNNGSAAPCTMLEATKAYDRVHYDKLFNMLVARDMPFVTIRLLLNMFTSHVTKVTWNGIYSNSFLVKNGVMQGGIVRPILFSAYLDELLTRLKYSKLGCYVGDLWVAALVYADEYSIPNSPQYSSSAFQCSTFV